MFFRRAHLHTPTFTEHLEKLKSAGFTVEPPSGRKALVHRNGFAALLEEAGSGQVRVVESGLHIGNEIAVLTDIGFQKIFAADSGKKTAALAEHLQALHAFGEDLRETIGVVSLYNESLGTTNERHLYDRVVDRDEGVPKRPWQR
jgi:hypothetical protein